MLEAFSETAFFLITWLFVVVLIVILSEMKNLRFRQELLGEDTNYRHEEVMTELKHVSKKLSVVLQHYNYRSDAISSQEGTNYRESNTTFGNQSTLMETVQNSEPP